VSFTINGCVLLLNAAAVPRATVLRRCESVPAACYAYTVSFPLSHHSRYLDRDGAAQVRLSFS
jgi:hypothetical protein